MTQVTPIEVRLRASVRLGAPHGDMDEREICARQMIEAATTIDRLRTALARVTAERDDEKHGRDVAVAALYEQLDDALSDCRVLAECFDGMNGADLSAKYGAGRSLRIKDAIARHADAKGGGA